MLDRDPRLVFIDKWARRARAETDPFDVFFAAWIALVVAAQRLRDFSGNDRYEDTDRGRVLAYFDARQACIVRALDDCDSQLRVLAARRGRGHRDPIVDTGNRDLRSTFSQLSQHYLGAIEMNNSDRVTATAELLNKVRNNVFHGAKIYDAGDDLELLQLVNPVLLAVLGRCEGV